MGLLKHIKERRMMGIKVDTLALHELELNLKVGNILIEGRKATLEDIAKLFKDLGQLLSLYNINTQPLTCEQIAKAADLRSSYNLTFYDSHHAASALLYDSKIISTDEGYEHIKDLTRINPYTIK